MRARRFKPEPPPPIMHRETSTDGLRVYCPNSRMWITFKTEEKRDRFFERYATQDSLRITGIAAQFAKIYDQLKKFESL